MRLLLLVAAGGAIGASARYALNVGVGRWLGPAFPWATLFANVSGSLAMGLLAGLIIGREGETVALRAFLATGVLGGFTTFSAFSLDFANLVGRGETLAALAYAAASVGLSIAGVLLGLAIARGIGS
jgi:CrcB protein